MALEEDMQSLPVYYDDEGPQTRPFLPFIVAPLRTSQDTLILGPTILSKYHDDFINRLYHNITTKQIRGMAMRAFRYRSMICVALILPTEQQDETGRAGLAVSLGFCIRHNTLSLKGHIVSEYLRVMLNVINRAFLLSLPNPNSANRLLEIITVAYGYPEQRDIVTQLELVADTLFLLGATAREFTRTSRRFPFRLPRFRVPLRKKASESNRIRSRNFSLRCFSNFL